MSVIDDVFEVNRIYAQNFTLGQLSLPAARKLAVVACMDVRLTVERVLGLTCAASSTT